MERKKKIDWEQRRYEIAKAALPQLQGIKEKFTEKAKEHDMIKNPEAWHLALNDSICVAAVKLADVLIEKLQMNPEDLYKDGIEEYDENDDETDND